MGWISGFSTAGRQKYNLVEMGVESGITNYGKMEHNRFYDGNGDNYACYYYWGFLFFLSNWFINYLSRRWRNSYNCVLVYDSEHFYIATFNFFLPFNMLPDIISLIQML